MMSDQETREALFELWMRFGTCIESDSSEGREMVDAILSRFNVTPKDESEWEYGAGYQADNGIEMRWFSMGSGAFTIREAAEREVERFSDAKIRLVRRRKPGPWEPVSAEAADA